MERPKPPPPPPLKPPKKIELVDDRREDLPVDTEAEDLLIGCLMVDSRRYNEVCRTLSPEDFFDRCNRRVYESIGKLTTGGIIDGRARNGLALIDVKAIADDLSSSGDERIRLADYARHVGTGWDYNYYAHRVKECSRKRAVALASQDFVREANQNGNADDLMSLVLRKASELGVGSGTKAQVSTIQQVIQRELIPSIERSVYGTNDDDDIGCATGWKVIDDRVGGLRRGWLIAVAGRPGQGKTSFATNIAASQAIESGRRVLLITLEQTQREIAEMVWMCRAGVGSVLMANYADEKTKRLTRLLEETDTMNSDQLLLMEGGHVSVDTIEAVCRLQSIHRGLDLVVIDYLQQIARPRDIQGVTYQIEHITTRLKHLAKQLRVPILLLCQLSRKFDDDSEEPQLHHLKDSGAIEQDCDVVMMVWRPKNGDLAKVKIAKNRHGLLGTVDLTFVGACKRFIEPVQDVETMKNYSSDLASFNDRKDFA